MNSWNPFLLISLFTPDMPGAAAPAPGGTALRLAVPLQVGLTDRPEAWLLSGLFVLTVALVGLLAWQVALRRQVRRLRMQLVEETASRKRAEAELAHSTAADLQLSEARFRAMFDNAAIGIALFDHNRTPLAVNNAVLSMTGGYTREEMLRMSGADITYPEDARVGAQEYAELMAGKRVSFQVEKRYVRKDGGIFWVRLSTSAVRNPDGTTRYLITMIEDIDERKKAQEELRRSEARFRAVFENSAIGILIMGLDHYPIEINDTTLKMGGGYTREEFMPLTGETLIFHEDRLPGSQEYADMIAGKRDSFTVEKRYIRKDQSMFWVRLIVSVVRNEKGEPLYVLTLMEDIDEAKRFQLELQQSEARFRALFDHADLGIVFTGIPQELNVGEEVEFLRLVQPRCNPALQRMFGYSEEELLTMDMRQLIHPDDQGLDRQLAKELYSGQRDEYRIEKRYVRRDGSVFLGRLINSLVRDASGKPRLAFGIVEDIDEERKAQEALRRSEARFRAILDNTAVGIALLTLDRRPIQVNQATMRIMGYREEELLSRCSIELAVEEDRQLDEDQYLRLVRGEIDQYVTEKRFRRKDNSVFWGRVIYSSVKDAYGRPQFLINLIEDIDQEKRVQEDLRQSEARFRAMFDNTSIGIALMSLDRRVLQVNQAAEHIVGYSPEELAVIHPSDLALEEDRLLDQELFTALLAGRINQYQVEKRYRHKDGHTFWGRVTYSSVKDAGGRPQYLIGLIEDIDAEKSAQERLAAQEAEYRRSLEQRVAERTQALQQEIGQRQRAEEALAAKAADEAVTAERNRLARELHDAVTQTLFSASLIAEVLPDLWAIDTGEAQRSTEELRQLTRGALAEMRTLLLELRPAVLTQARFEDLLRQLCEALIGRARLPIELKISGQRPLPPEVQVALYRISQEALNNIVKYARPSQVVVDLLLTAGGVHLSIRDNGVGFNPAEIRPDSLGQRIMRERAENIGAELTITSQPGQGTEVTAIWQEFAGLGDEPA